MYTRMHIITQPNGTIQINSEKTSTDTHTDTRAHKHTVTLTFGRKSEIERNT